MKIRVVVLALGMIGLGAWGYAQVEEFQRVQTPVTLTGSDIGFRIEAYRGATVMGKLVVKVNGKWIDAQPAGGSLKIAANDR